MNMPFLSFRRMPGAPSGHFTTTTFILLAILVTLVLSIIGPSDAWKQETLHDTIRHVRRTPDFISDVESFFGAGPTTSVAAPAPSTTTANPPTVTSKTSTSAAVVAASPTTAAAPAQASPLVTSAAAATPAAVSSSVPDSASSDSSEPATQTAAASSSGGADSLLSSIEGLLSGDAGSSGLNTSGILQSLEGLFQDGLNGFEEEFLSIFNGTGFTLGVGLGEGAATSLNISTESTAETRAQGALADNDIDDSGINALALDLGNGLATEILPLVLQGNLNISTFVPYVYPIAQGLGNGTVMGLNIFVKALHPPTGTDITDLVGSLGFGLTESITSNLDFSRLNLGSGFNVSTLPAGINLRDILEGAGEGLSQGTLTGLGLASSKLTTQMNSQPATNDSMLDIPLAVQEFMSGLSDSFVANIDLSKAESKLGGMGDSLDAPKIVEGFARGLVDGAVSGISAAGGFENVVKGNISAAAWASARIDAQDETFSFDDSLNGSAIAFAYGLSNQVVLQVGSVIGSKLSELGTSKLRRRTIPLQGRAISTDEVATTPIINATYLNFLAQQSVNTLQCNGIGGLGSIFVGLSDSKTVSLKQLSSFKLSSTTNELLPTGPLTIDLDGNTYNLDLQQIDSAKINGLSVIEFGVFTGLHIIFSGLGFLLFFPLFIILSCTRHVMELASITVSDTHRAWQRRVLYFLFAPTALLGLVFGMIGMGNSGHFRTAHSVLGLLAILASIGLLAFRFYYLRCLRIAQSIEQRLNYAVVFKPWKYGKQEWLIALYGLIFCLTNATVPLGVQDLQTISLCLVNAFLSLPLAVVLGGGAMLFMFTATALAGLVVCMESRTSNKAVSISSPVLLAPEDNPFKNSLEANQFKNSLETFPFKSSVEVDRIETSSEKNATVQYVPWSQQYVPYSRPKPELPKIIPRKPIDSASVISKE